MSAAHLVTGAAGLMGYAVTRRLLADGERVVAVDRRASEELGVLAAAHPDRLRVIAQDLTDPDLDLPAERFRSVNHFAAVLGVAYVEDHPYETVAANTRGVMAVLDHACSHGTDAFLFASSSEAYAFGVASGTVPLPTPEDVPIGVADPALPRNAYAASKIAGETAVFGAARPAGFRPVVVRLHNVYGPRMRPTHVIPAMLARCRAAEDPFPVHGLNETRAFLYVDDAARAWATLIESSSDGVVHVGAEDETRIGDLLELVFEVTGHRPTEVVERPTPAGSVARRVPDVSRLRALGFAPEVSLADGVARCWEAREGAPTD